jgi:hypothetical protein
MINSMSWYKRRSLNSSEYVYLLPLASVRIDQGNHEGGSIQGMPILGGERLLYEQRLFGFHRR